LSPVSVNDIISATASQFDTTAEAYAGFRSNAPGRDLAAYLCRRYNRATLRELLARFDLSHPDSASDLSRREAKRLEQSKQMTCHVSEIEEKLGLNPESRV
jgi:putative transposase